MSPPCFSKLVKNIISYVYLDKIFAFFKWLNFILFPTVPLSFQLLLIWVALPDLVPLVQFKKSEKH